VVASAPSDPVDVLIVGAGASGAAVAWSLAETRMHILCLEQGDWMRPDEYPSTRRDWEQLAVRDLRLGAASWTNVRRPRYSGCCVKKRRIAANRSGSPFV